MQRLEGFIDRSRVPSADDLKKHSLFFDKISLLKLRGLQQFYDMLHKSTAKDLKRAKAEFRWLEEQGFVRLIDEEVCNERIRQGTAHAWDPKHLTVVTAPGRIADAVIREKLHGRHFAVTPYDRHHCANVSENLSDAWVRLFAADLTGKKQTENEIKDDLEWMLHQYSEAMRVHNLKAGNSFIEVYLIPAVELVEDLVTIKWSKIAKGLLGVSKREVELMEAEMKAPGRECAYIFETQKRFGNS
jgi:hypothetical protein